MAIDLKLIDKLLADYKKRDDILGESGLLKQLTKALLETACGGTQSIGESGSNDSAKVLRAALTAGPSLGVMLRTRKLCPM
jgi:hypothetical protein